VNYVDYLARLKQQVAGTPLRLRQYGVVTENGRDHPLVTLELGDSPSVVFTAGFHGEEPAGPLTFLERLEDVAGYAEAKRVSIRIYPCINPSGFEGGHRYNASGEKPNNDLLRYELPDGTLQGELSQDLPGVKWRVFVDSPKETRALVQDLEKLPTPVAALDIHQDNYLSGAFTYAYIFGDRTPYRYLAQAAARHVPLAAKTRVDEHRVTDEDGLLVFHDGSVTDYFHRRGALHTATLETTTATPLLQCHAVNLLWIRGFIDLAERGK